jgi:hypothetical protein
MLIAKLDSARREIAGLHVLEEAAKDAQAYATRAAQLQTPAAALAQLGVLVQEFRRRAIAIPLNAQQLQALAYQTRTMLAGFRDDHKSIVASSGEIGARFFDPLKNAPGDVRGALQRAWTDYIDATLPPQQQPELLDTLKRLPGFSERVAEIGRLYREAALLRSRLPQSSDEIDKIAALATALRTAWASLPTEGIPADVRIFLVAALGDGATFSQLTGPVVEWLGENNLLDSIRITLRAQTA